MRVKEGAKEEAILRAAVKVFAQRGYHEAKISSIAEKAKWPPEASILLSQQRRDPGHPL